MNKDPARVAPDLARPPLTDIPDCRWRQQIVWLTLSAFVLGIGSWLSQTHWNADLLLLQHAHATLPGWLWLTITIEGDGWVMFAVVSALDGGRRTMVAAYLRCALLLALLTPLAKALMAIPRPAAALPPGSLHIVGPQLLGSNSFPSGHALTAGACAVILCMLLPRGDRTPATDWLLRLAIGLDLALVAYSRTAVGAHWPADVLMGLGLGILVAIVALRAEDRSPWAARLQTRAGSAGIALLQLVAAVAIFRLGSDGRAEPAVALVLGVGTLLLFVRSLRQLPGQPLRHYHAG